MLVPALLLCALHYASRCRAPPTLLTHHSADAMYRKVYRPRPAVRRAMAAVEVGMLLVCVGAAVGAFRQMVVGWQDIQFFQ